MCHDINGFIGQYMKRHTNCHVCNVVQNVHRYVRNLFVYFQRPPSWISPFFLKLLQFGNPKYVIITTRFSLLYISPDYIFRKNASQLVQLIDDKNDRRNKRSIDSFD